MPAEYDTAKFLKSITKDRPAPQPVPIAVTKEPPAKPPAPIETKPVDRQAEFAKRLDAELDAQIEFERRPDLFDDTEGGWANVQLCLDYIAENHDGYLSRQSVSDAIQTLRRSGDLIPLFRPEPEKAPPTTSQNPAPAKPVAPIPPPDPDEGLPPLPQWVIIKLGTNKLRTRRDVYAVPNWLYSEIYRSVHGAAFKARVDAIGRKA